MAVLGEQTPPAAEQLTAEVAQHAAFSAVRGRGNDGVLKRLLALGDAVSVFASLAAALLLSSRGDVDERLVWALFAIPLMALLFKIYGLYDRDMKRISHTTVDDLPWLFHATVGGTLLLWVYSKLTPMHRLDFAEALLFASGVLVLTPCVRFGVRSAFARIGGSEPALLVGGGRMAEILISKLAAHPEYRAIVVGVLTDGHSASPNSHGLPAFGSLDDLERIAAQNHVGRVIVSPTDIDDHRLEELLRRCRKLAMKVTVLPKLSDVLGPAVEVDDVEGVTVLGVNPPWLPPSSRALKRVMDVVIAAVMLVILAPVMAIIAIAVKLDSPGPVFFAQRRVGRGGRRFRVFKFRTMVTGSEQLRAELLALSTDPSWLKLDRDPRITRVGGHIRRLSLDELPQLWNVLRGQMSMVGPRPLIEDEDENVEDWARGRLDLTPGITGYWQVLGRTRIPFEEMVKLDYLYVMSWSLWEDIKLILRTLPTVIGGRGAN